MATSGGGANSRLSVDDWVQEGFRVLAEDGVKALTLGRLCSCLGVTKGSASAQFLDNPLQRAKRDVDVISGHVVFDYNVSRELAGALGRSRDREHVSAAPWRRASCRVVRARGLGRPHVGPADLPAGTRLAAAIAPTARCRYCR
jgi:hypothetical protein